MKGSKQTRWFCDRCDMTLTTYVLLSEAPLHLCDNKLSNKREPVIQPMKEVSK